MFERVSRRGILTGGLAAISGVALPAALRGRQDRRVMRLVHFTDAHFKNDSDTVSRFARCLDKIRNNERPDLVFQGGDIVFNGSDADRATVTDQYFQAGQLIKRHLNQAPTHCIGNHDVWGWTRQDKAQIASDAMFGKAMWLNWTGYSSTYFSFDRANWHFVVLDSIQESRRGAGYVAKLDDAQWKWLEDDIAGVPAGTNICVVSHAPFIHAGAQFLGNEHGGQFWTISGALLHVDARRFKNLLAHHPNIKLCLSGHIHMFSRIHYNGVAHIGNGAVSGAWWRGDMQETHPGYAVVDLYADGKVKSRFETY